MKKTNGFFSKGILLLLLSAFGLFCSGQRALQPGDAVPPDLQRILPNKKLVIIDFWSTWCKSCLKALPKLDSIQEKFGEAISILAVTDQSKAVVEQFFKKKLLYFKRLSFITDDIVMKRYFEYQSLPHTAWIMGGSVLYVTYGYNVTESNIKKVLTGEQVKMEQKDGSNVYDFRHPIWAKQNEHFGTSPEQYSYLTGWLSNYGGSKNGGYFDSATRTSVLQFVNMDLSELILRVYPGEFRFRNRVIMEGKVADWLVWNHRYAEGDERREKNLICYEIRLKEGNVQRRAEFIRGDLEKFLDFTIRVEKRKVKCYVIRKKKEILPVCNEPNLICNGERNYSCEAFPSFVAILKHEFRDHSNPIVDSSGFNGVVGICPGAKPRDIEEAIRMLASLGFEMKEEVTEVDMLVLKDNL